MLARWKLSIGREEKNFTKGLLYSVFKYYIKKKTIEAYISYTLTFFYSYIWIIEYDLS